MEKDYDMSKLSEDQIKDKLGDIISSIERLKDQRKKKEYKGKLVRQWRGNQGNLR